MGLRIRKRTKGSKTWLNGSISKKGAGLSGSYKIADNITWNTGDLLNGKTSSRLTVNLGNGVTWVHQDKKPRRRKATPKVQDLDFNYHSGGFLNSLRDLFKGIVKVVLGLLWLACLGIVGLAVFSFFIWLTV